MTTQKCPIYYRKKMLITIERLQGHNYFQKTTKGFFQAEVFRLKFGPDTYFAVQS